MTSIDHMVSAQPGIIPQVTGSLNHARFWSATVFLDHYSNYCYAHIMRGNSAEETLRAKEAYERLAATHWTRVCAYREYNGRFAEPQSKEASQTCGQEINYCGVGYHHQNKIIEIRIKELTVGNRTLLLHVTRLCLEAVSTMMWTFSFKVEYHSYNSLEIYKDKKTPEKKFSGVEFHFPPTEYHIWGMPCLCTRILTTERASRAIQMGTNG